MLQNIFSSMMTVTIKVTSTLQSMKQSKLHLSFLIVFTERECVNPLSTLFRMEGGESAKRFPASFLQHFWLLVLITFPHSCQISGPYLVLILNYWTWTKNTAQKNWIFWSNPYKIEFMITFLMGMLSYQCLVTWSYLQYDLSYRKILWRCNLYFKIPIF